MSQWALQHRFTLAAVGVVMLAFGGVALQYWRFSNRKGPLDAPVAVNWPSSLGAREAAQLASDLGLTDQPTWLELHFRLVGATRCFVPGPHLLSPASPRELVAMLCRSEGRAKTRVTFPEGMNRFAMAERLESHGVVSRAAFLAATSDRELLLSLGIDRATKDEADTAEGFLFPATYPFHRDADPAELVRMLVREADRRWRAATAKYPQGLAALTAMSLGRRQIVALASMVEKEAAVAEERPIIASVFLNRLRNPELPRLQSDPTAVYGCLVMPERIPACHGFDGKATPEINRDPANIYSTYVVNGVPPGPIANPGEASLIAVLAPADTRYHYFCAKGGGRHTFSETYDQHQEAVRQLRASRQ
jgi:UPF0755 protein